MRSDKTRRALGGCPTIRDAVRDADRSKAAARHEQSGEAGELLVDRGNAAQVTNLVLRTLARPSIQARKEGRSRDGHHLRQRLPRELDQLLIALVQSVRVAAAPEKCPQQDAI